MSNLVGTATMPNGDTCSEASTPAWRVVTDPTGTVIVADDMTGVTWTQQTIASDDDPDALAAILTAPAWQTDTDYADGALVTDADGIVWTCRLAHTSQTTWEPGAIGTLALWQRIGSTTGNSAWTVSTQYSLGSHVTYSGTEYVCLQAHTSQEGWEPPNVPALWDVYITPPVGPQPWVQPTGAHDAYGIGDTVTHEEQVWVSIAANNVWEPGVYGWELVPD